MTFVMPVVSALMTVSVIAAAVVINVLDLVRRLIRLLDLCRIWYIAIPEIPVLVHGAKRRWRDSITAAYEIIRTHIDVAARRWRRQ